MTKNNDAVDLAVMAERIKNIQSMVADINSRLNSNYVTREEFQPVRNVTFGLVGLILTGVVVAILTMIIKR